MKNLVKQLVFGTLVMLTVTSCSKKDNDDPAPPVEKQTDVYTAGHVVTSDGSTVTHIATLWKNGVAQRLSNTESWVNKVTVVGNDVYAVGREYEGTKSVAKIWKNGTATSPINSSSNTEAYTISVSANGDVYVLVREWSNISSEHKVVKNGVPLILNPSNTNNTALPMDVYLSGEDVYVAGIENVTATNSTKAVYWKNGSLTVLPPISGNDPIALKIFVTGSQVYVLGQENRLSNHAILLWKDGVPTGITDGAKDASPNALFVSGSDVYIVSDEYDQTTFNSVSTVWKNGASVLTKNGDDFSFTSVYALNNNWYLVGDGVETALWKNGVVESAMPEGTSLWSVFVSEN